MDCDKLEFLSFSFPRTPPVELLKSNNEEEETGGRRAKRRNKAWMVWALASPGAVLKGLGGTQMTEEGEEKWREGEQALAEGRGTPLQVSQNAFPKWAQSRLQDNALPAESSLISWIRGPRWTEGKLTCLPSLVLLKIFCQLVQPLKRHRSFCSSLCQVVKPGAHTPRPDPVSL